MIDLKKRIADKPRLLNMEKTKLTLQPLSPARRWKVLLFIVATLGIGVIFLGEETPEQRAKREQAQAAALAEQHAMEARRDQNLADLAARQEKARSPAQPEQETQVSPKQLCKAAIAAITGRDPSTMKVEPAPTDAVKVSYVRQSDNQPFSYYCAVAGKAILWGNTVGNWIKDADVFYRIQDGKLVIVQRFEDKSESVDAFDLVTLGGR